MTNEDYWNPLVPELTVADLAASLRFYETAGFAVRFRRDDPPFAYIELGQAHLMLEQEHADGWRVGPLDRPLGRGINLQIEVADAERVRASLLRAGATPLHDVQDAWYRVSDDREEGQREFLVQDPDGYLLRFAQVLAQRPAG